MNLINWKCVFKNIYLMMNALWPILILIAVLILVFLLNFEKVKAEKYRSLHVLMRFW